MIAARLAVSRDKTAEARSVGARRRAGTVWKGALLIATGSCSRVELVMTARRAAPPILLPPTRLSFVRLVRNMVDSSEVAVQSPKLIERVNAEYLIVLAILGSLDDV